MCAIQITKLNKKEKIYKNGLYIINALFFVGAIVGVISMIASMVNYKEYLDLLGSNTSWIIAIVVVGIAFLMIIISALGFLGGLGENTILLKIYVAIVAVLMIFLVVSGIIAFANRDGTFENVRVNMLNNMKNYNPGSADFETVVWDDIQQSFECCGVMEHQDWAKYHDSYGRSSIIKKHPDSCSSEDNKIQYVDGCLEKLNENIRLKHWNIGGAIAGIFLYLVLTICIACIVMKHMKEDEYLIETTPCEKGQDNYGIQSGPQKNDNLGTQNQQMYPTLQKE